MPEDKCLLDPQRDCLGLIKARELEEDLKDLKNDVNDLRRQNSSSHERIFEQLHDLEKAEVQQGEQYKNILEKLVNLTNTLNLMDSRLATIETKPGKRWESVVGQVIDLVVAAVIGVMLAKFGLG